LFGEVGILAGSREMVRLYHRLELDDSSFNVIRALDSETDDCLLEPIAFPIGAGRSENNIRKIKEYEESYREEIFKVCQALLDEPG
jgi:hypothetical protein